MEYPRRKTNRLAIDYIYRRWKQRENPPIDTYKNKHDNLKPDRHSEWCRTPLQRGWDVWDIKLLLRSWRAQM